MKTPQEIAASDVRLSIVTWAVMEAVCFGLIPLTAVYAFEDVEAWFVPSILLGVIGACILGGSSWLVAVADTLYDPKKQLLYRWLGRLSSIVGFVAIAFPLALGVVTFGLNIFDVSRN